MKKILKIMKTQISLERSMSFFNDIVRQSLHLQKLLFLNGDNL